MNNTKKNTEMTVAYISLGGNLGDEKQRFSHALDSMARWPGIAILARSSVYRTEPQGDPNLPWFTNQVAALACPPEMTPGELVTALLQLETALGRTRDPNRRYGPRTIDLDLLLFGDAVSTDVGALVPHPRMAERAFVLIPLLEIAPECEIPGIGSAAACLARLQYTVVGSGIYQAATQNS